MGRETGIFVGMIFPKYVREVLVVTFALALGVAPAAAQGRLGSDLLDLGRDDDRSLWDERRAPVADGGPSVGAFGQRLDLGLVDVGFSMAPRRLMLDTPADSASSAVRYRLGDSDLPRSDVGLDLRLRWPSWTGALEPRLSPLRPYLSFGPALSRALGQDPMPASRATSAARADTGLPVGMRGAVGLTWQLAPDASLYGEYRLTQDRAFGRRHGGEAGADLFYGFSLRF